MSDTTLKSFMSIMGTGPRSSDDLTYDQARALMDGLLDETVHPVTFGATLLALRWKGEAIDELAGFLDVLVERRAPVPSPRTRWYLDVAGRFDGKLKTIHTGLAASLLAAAAGLPVVTHSGQDVPVKTGGVTLIDVVEALGWDPSPSPTTAREALDAHGFAYLHQATYSPPLERLRSWRQELGVRSVFNTVESMLNPLSAPAHLGSFYHLPYARRTCRVLERCQSMDLERIVMVQGMEGQPEARPGSCKLAVWDRDGITDRTLRSSEWDCSFTREQLEQPGSAAEVSADWLRRLFQDRSVPDAYRHSVVLNTAVRLWAGDAAEDVDEAVRRSREVLRSSAPRQLMADLEEVFGREQEEVSHSV